jgi:hypothetical protein
MLSQAGLEQTQLSFTHTWIEGKSYRVGFASRPMNPVQHEACLGVFECRCVTDRPGRFWAALVSLRNVECPVHCPDTSKEIHEALNRLARRHRNLTGSARELYQKQQVTYSNGVISADPVAAMERAREARDATRESWDRMQAVSDRNAHGIDDPPPEANTQIAFIEVD